jgi:putative integral membrane protein (TIGR02587 family)
MPSTPKIRPIRESLREYGRGIAGGLLFSFPLLYTMEVWWTGFIATPFQLIVIILFTFALLLGYNRYAGMHPEASWGSIVMDSVEELGIGFLLSSALLLMLSRITFTDMSLFEIMGKVVLEAMVVSIGVSVGTAQLGMQEVENEQQADRDEKLKKDRQSGLGSLMVLALCGSILVGGNVAPTEETLVIGVESSPVHILAMVLVSLLLCVLITFFVNFEGTDNDSPSDTDLFTIIQQTTLCYLVALGASALLLWFFGRFDSVNFWTGFSQCVTLGVLSSLGASAGRLLIN